MKTIKYSAIALGVALFGLASCSDDWKPVADTTGTLNMSALTMDVSEIEKVINHNVSTESRSEASYDLNSFIVKISDASGAAVEQWTYAQTPEVVTLNPGAYKLEVYSHDVQPAEWEKPYFYVAKDFNIVAGAIERIGELTARLSNAAVSIRFDESILKHMGNDVTVEVKANDEGKLVYTSDETRKGYFKVLDGSSTMVVTFDGTVAGNKEHVVVPAVDLAMGQHRIITFKAKENNNTKPDETGSVNPGGISIDASVTDEDVNGDITLEEEYTVVDPADRPDYEPPLNPGPNDPDDPVGPGEEGVIEFTAKDSPKLSLEGVNETADFPMGANEPAVVGIYAEKGIKSLLVKIESGTLDVTDVGLEPEFDLADPKPSLVDGLKGLGFPVGDEVVGKTEVAFDITTFVPLLGSFEGDHKFTITVTDTEGTSKTLVLKFHS